MNKKELEIFDKDVLIQMLIQQDAYINEVRNVLRFCAMDGVGTFYQQQSAKEMLLNNTKINWSSRHNPDGTFNDEHKKWIKECGGQEALDKVIEMENELLQK